MTSTACEWPNEDDPDIVEDRCRWNAVTIAHLRDGASVPVCAFHLADIIDRRLVAWTQPALEFDE